VRVSAQQPVPNGIATAPDNVIGETARQQASDSVTASVGRSNNVAGKCRTAQLCRKRKEEWRRVRACQVFIANRGEIAVRVIKACRKARHPLNARLTDIGTHTLWVPGCCVASYSAHIVFVTGSESSLSASSLTSVHQQRCRKRLGLLQRCKSMVVTRLHWMSRMNKNYTDISCAHWAWFRTIFEHYGSVYPSFRAIGEGNNCWVRNQQLRNTLEQYLEVRISFSCHA
jgi:hypothetical protein